MRWLKGLVSLGLLVAAAALTLSTALSDHTDDYGQVPLPEGGVVHLPQGTVVVYYTQLGDSSDPVRRVSAPIGFQAVPVGGGSAVPVRAVNGGTSAVAVQRSETIGELGAVAKLDVPASGNYRVAGTTDLPAGTSFLKFGTNAGQAVLNRWHLLVGLVIAALLIGLLPLPRQRRRWEDEYGEPTGWSSDPRAPYAG